MILLSKRVKNDGRRMDNRENPGPADDAPDRQPGATCDDRNGTAKTTTSIEHAHPRSIRSLPPPIGGQIHIRADDLESRASS